MADKLPTDGAFGLPPAHAPHEVTRDLQPDAVAEQLAKAHAHERQLQPLVFGAKIRSDEPPTAEQVLEQTFSAPPPTAEPPRKTMTPAIQETPVAPVERSHQPAASNSDSPSRGIPRQIDDPGKQITGGFGNMGEAQYYALDGLELKELVKHLMGKLLQQVENDLHFSMAITYPRVEVKVAVQVSGYAKEAEFTLFKGDVRDKTTVENAVANGATPRAFELSEERNEFNAAGEPENPPDRLRDEVGLEKPRKQMVEMGPNRVMVDRAPNLGGSF